MVTARRLALVVIPLSCVAFAVACGSEAPGEEAPAERNPNARCEGLSLQCTPALPAEVFSVANTISEEQFPGRLDALCPPGTSLRQGGGGRFASREELVRALCAPATIDAGGLDGSAEAGDASGGSPEAGSGDTGIDFATQDVLLSSTMSCESVSVARQDGRLWLRRSAPYPSCTTETCPGGPFFSLLVIPKGLPLETQTCTWGR